MFTGVWRDFWICLSDFTSQAPQKRKILAQNIFSGRRKPLFYSRFCDFYLGPIFGQIGPIVGNTLGHLMKAFSWIGPKSKIGPKMLWNTLFYRVWGVSNSAQKCFSNRTYRKQIGPIEGNTLTFAMRLLKTDRANLQLAKTRIGITGVLWAPVILQTKAITS